MDAKGTGNLSKIGKYFSDETAARELLEQLRWPNGPVCFRCGGADPYKLKVSASGKNKVARQGLYKCRACRKPFTVTTGTVFEGSKVPMSKWVLAVHLMSASKKGLSALQLQRMLGVTYRAAWFINHRLRYAMASKDGMFQKLSGTVEVDETYIGGYRRLNKIGAPKVPVLALVQRKGRVIAMPMEKINGKSIGKMVDALVAHNATMMTDEATFYRSVAHDAGLKHQTVHHRSKEYVRGSAHTNTVEGFFSLLKRGINGSFHHVSKGHLHRYVDEFAFRYNHRSKLGFNDSDRATMIVTGAEGKRLTYQTSKGVGAA